MLSPQRVWDGCRRTEPARLCQRRRTPRSERVPPGAGHVQYGAGTMRACRHRRGAQPRAIQSGFASRGLVVHQGVSTPPRAESETW